MACTQQLQVLMAAMAISRGRPHLCHDKPDSSKAPIHMQAQKLAVWLVVLFTIHTSGNSIFEMV